MKLVHELKQVSVEEPVGEAVTAAVEVAAETIEGISPESDNEGWSYNMTTLKPGCICLDFYAGLSLLN
jgi:hypothetical protein